MASSGSAFPGGRAPAQLFQESLTGFRSWAGHLQAPESPGIPTSPYCRGQSAGQPSGGCGQGSRGEKRAQAGEAAVREEWPALQRVVLVGQVARCGRGTVLSDAGARWPQVGSASPFRQAISSRPRKRAFKAGAGGLEEVAGTGRGPPSVATSFSDPRTDSFFPDFPILAVAAGHSGARLSGSLRPRVGSSGPSCPVTPRAHPAGGAHSRATAGPAGRGRWQAAAATPAA